MPTIEHTTERELRCPKCHKFLAAVTDCDGEVEMRFRCPRCKTRPTITVRERRVKVKVDVVPD
jgi:phage FluMu protein Com